MKKQNLITVAALLIAVGLTVAGVLTGQPQDVLAKAARVCLECIGVG